MTTEKIIEIAKEKFGLELTEKEAQDYLKGKTPIPDEALDLVGGGAGCDDDYGKCLKCRLYTCYPIPDQVGYYKCINCGAVIKRY